MMNGPYYIREVVFGVPGAVGESVRLNLAK
jgi:hypothetical protein